MVRERQTGQAGVELIGVTVALAFATLVGWQAVVAAYSWQTAQSAARTAARAGMVGAPVEQAALAVLPDHLATRATVRRISDGGGDRIRVTLAVPVVLGGGSMGRVAGEARLAP